MVTGVTSPMLNGGWYLNLHQGNSNNILNNGQPDHQLPPAALRQHHDPGLATRAAGGAPRLFARARPLRHPSPWRPFPFIPG